MKINLLATSAAVVLLTAGVASAQSTAATDQSGGYPEAAMPAEEDEGMDLGWIGLLGLVGLLGLRKRSTEHVRTHNDTSTGTSHR